MGRQESDAIRAKVRHPVHHWHSVNSHCPTCPCYGKWPYDPLDQGAHPFCEAIDQEEFDTRNLIRAIKKDW